MPQSLVDPAWPAKSGARRTMNIYPILITVVALPDYSAAILLRHCFETVPVEGCDIYGDHMRGGGARSP